MTRPPSQSASHSDPEWRRALAGRMKGEGWNFRSRLLGRLVLTMAVVLSVFVGEARAEIEISGAQSHIISGRFENGEFTRTDFINSVVGWDQFFNAGFLGSGRVIGNIEAGFAWDGHEAFLRPDGAPPAIARSIAGTGALAEVDFHATMVAHVLVGTGYIADSEPANFTLAGIGMAPLASVWSGSIATSYSTSQTGAFTTTDDSVISVYREFAEGIDGQRPDAINSSWGGSDPSASSNTSVALDGLAKENPSVVFVSSAGNGGSNPVSAPGSLFNGLTVGAVGGSTFLDPSEFSSHGLVDFLDPVSDQLTEGVRAAVDLVAPGEDLFLAAYLGATGALGASDDPEIAAILQTPPPDDLFFLNQSGTSFSAPIVSGAIALLRDVAANDLFLNLNGVPTATDSRVMKAILMASATPTNGWDNAQSLEDVDGSLVVTTTQSLDARTGAGALNLTDALEVFILSDTRDLAGLTGGVITGSGWDFGSVAALGFNDYHFSNPFESQFELSISLNWFAGRGFDEPGNVGTNLFFSDLNLQIWSIVNGEFSQLIGQSISTYNNTEFLRLNLDSGAYGVRVLFSDWVFDATGGAVSAEDYALAWQTTAIPEFGHLAWLVIVLLLVARHRFREAMDRVT